MVSGWTIRKRFAVFLLVAINVGLILSNINYMPQSKSGRKYSDYFSSLNPFRLNQHSRSSAIKEKSINSVRLRNVTTVKKKPLVWHLVKNSDSVLPVYRNLNKVLERLDSDKDTLMKEYSAFRLDSKVKNFKKAANIGDTGRLEDKLRDVLYTGRKLKIGVIGASITLANTACFENSMCTHYDILQNWLESILDIAVDLHVAAVDLSNSEYFAYCIKTHLDLDSMDIVLWELAVEDYLMRNDYIRNEYFEAGRPQEEVTRQILKSPNRPYLIYVNFVQGQEILNRRCLNSEYYAGRYLSMHYNVTSISWQFSFCTQLYSNIFRLSDFTSRGGGIQPSSLVYGQMGLLLIHHFETYLRTLLEEEIESMGRRSKSVKRMMASHDQYLKDYDIALENKQQEEQQQALVDYDLMLQDNLAAEFNSSLPKLAGKGPPAEPVKGQLIEPLFEDETWVSSPQCYAASQPITSRSYWLEVGNNHGWVLTRKQGTNWWVSSLRGESVQFSVVIKQLEGYDAVVAVTKVVCDQCGQALVWIDDQFHSSTLMDGQGQREGFAVQEISSKIEPGKHAINIKNMQDRHFKVSAVMVAYKKLHAVDPLRQQFLKFNRKIINP